MLGGETPSFTRQCKTNNGVSTDQKSQAWLQHGTANVFDNFNVLGSRMAIPALNHHHGTLQFKLIGLDILLSDNLNPDQFLLTQTFGCIAVIGGWVGHLLTSISARSSLSLRSQVRNKETERAKIVSFFRSSAALCYCLG